MKNEEAQHHLLSKKELVKSLLLSMLLAVVILIFVVLPKAYGIDVIGVGKLLGLSEKLSEESVIEDTVTIVLPARYEIEYKVKMDEGKTLFSSWKASEVLYFDYHGEPEGDTTGYYKTYEEGEKSQAENTQEMPFTGSHGWYWRNDTDNDVTITLILSGEYTIEGEKFKSPLN